MKNIILIIKHIRFSKMFILVKRLKNNENLTFVGYVMKFYLLDLLYNRKKINFVL